jgi:hypothetical protein
MLIRAARAAPAETPHVEAFATHGTMENMIVDHPYKFKKWRLPKAVGE